MLVLDTTLGIGTFDGGNFTMSYDGAICGLLVGGTYKFVDKETASYKPVHVDSYTRIQNGKKVHVKSHYRSKPGHAGSSKLDICELRFGYWFPITTLELDKGYFSKLYFAPIIGVCYPLNEDGYTTNEALFGASVKLTYDIIGLTLQATNKSLSIGMSFVLTENFWYNKK